MQHLLHSTELNTAVLWSLGPWGRPCSAIYPISACIIPPCACVKFAVYSVALFFLRVAVLGISFSPTLTERFISIYLFYAFIHLFIYVSSTEPSVFRVMGAQGGLGTRLGRPVGCSSTMGCGCSSST